MRSLDKEKGSRIAKALEDFVPSCDNPSVREGCGLLGGQPDRW